MPVGFVKPLKNMNVSMITIEFTLKQARQTQGCINHFLDMLAKIDGNEEAQELMSIRDKIEDAILNE